MRITEQALSEFEALWREENPDKQIGKQELLDMATRLLHVVEIIYRYPKNND